ALIFTFYFFKDNAHYVALLLVSEENQYDEGTKLTIGYILKYFRIRNSENAVRQPYCGQFYRRYFFFQSKKCRGVFFVLDVLGFQVNALLFFAARICNCVKLFCFKVDRRVFAISPAKAGRVPCKITFPDMPDSTGTHPVTLVVVVKQFTIYNTQ